MVVLSPGKTHLVVKLDRTDTTLDLSLMAKEAGEKEKTEQSPDGSICFYVFL
jgi:hypothetical protein